jgi:hypothetical protein
MTLRCIAIAVLLVGCEDERCLNGICPDWSETRTFPGPCSAAFIRSNVEVNTITFTYENERIIGTSYTTTIDEPRRGVRGSTFSYSSNGDFDRVTAHPTFQSFENVWSFEGDRVIRSGFFDGIFDAAEFRFFPLVGTGLVEPEAELGQLSEGARVYTWSTEGTRRIRHCEETNETVTYTLDDRGRIIMIELDEGGDGVIERTSEFVFDGDLLVSRRHPHPFNFSIFRTEIAWTHDVGGNVVEGTGAEGIYREVFDYDCW